MRKVKLGRSEEGKAGKSKKKKKRKQGGKEKTKGGKGGGGCRRNYTRVCILDEEGKAAVVVRQKGLWMLPGGKVEEGEGEEDAAISEVDKSGSKPVPMHLRNAVTSDMKKMGYGDGYKYSHNYENHFSKMLNLPEDLSTKGFYYPSDQGSETQVKKWLEKLWGADKFK